MFRDRVHFFNKLTAEMSLSVLDQNTLRSPVSALAEFYSSSRQQVFF